MTSAEVFPAHWQADVVLRDGRPVCLRPVIEADEPDLQRFHEQLSEQSLHTRFFSASGELIQKEIKRMLTADQRKRVALVAWSGDDIAGVAIYDRVQRAEAEIAFTVADAHQGRGLGSVLLEHLSAIARENGIHRFTAEVLTENRRMLDTFTSAGLQLSEEIEEGVARIDFDIDPTHETRRIARRREHQAEALSVRRIVDPEAIAILCDTIAVDTIAWRTLSNVLDSGFTGRVVVITDPEELDTDSIPVPVHATLAHADAQFDLVISAQTPDSLEASLADCAAAGVRGIVLVTGGFVVAGDYSRQIDLVHAVRRLGMRLIGPSALGFVNTDPRHLINASLAEPTPGRGRVGVFAQTAAYGQAMLREVEHRGLGVSTFISVGNRADISANDLLQFWEDDDVTSLVLLHLETIGNPRKFLRITRRLAQRKPVVVVRAGRSNQAVPLGHAVRPTELPDDAITAMFRQAGVIQVDSLAEMFDLAGLLAFQPTIHGRRVAFVSDAQALGVQAVDLAREVGLDPVEQVHLTAEGADEQTHTSLIESVLADPSVDAVVVLHVPPVFGVNDELLQSVQQCAPHATKPLLAVMLGHQSGTLPGQVGAYGLPGHGSVPLFSDVRASLKALACVADYIDWRSAPRGTVPTYSDIEPQRGHLAVREPFESLTAEEPVAALNDVELKELLDSFGIDLWATRRVESEEQAVQAARELGYPVVLKTLDQDLVHRLDLGGLRLRLENEAALRTAHMSLISSLPPGASSDIALQHMAPPGVSCVLRTVEDPLFGPVVSFRIGGVIPELLADDGYRIPPFTDRDASALLRSPRAAQMFNAITGLGDRRWSTPFPQLRELLIRIARMADAMPEVQRVELNPVIVHANGVAVLGAAGWVSRPQVRTDLEARRLL